MSTTRTNIVIDDQLLASAMEATGAKTKREAVETALKVAVRRAAALELIRMAGQVEFDEDFLAEERAGRMTDEELAL